MTRSIWQELNRSFFFEGRDFGFEPWRANDGFEALLMNLHNYRFHERVQDAMCKRKKNDENGQDLIRQELINSL